MTDTDTDTDDAESPSAPEKVVEALRGIDDFDEIQDLPKAARLAVLSTVAKLLGLDTLAVDLTGAAIVESSASIDELAEQGDLDPDSQFGRQVPDTVERMTADTGDADE